MDETGLPPIPKKHLYDYKGSCWWCGLPADSREHKWKRTEVSDLFGKGSYDSVLWVTDSIDNPQKIEKIRGPNAARLKFSNTLCGNCNGTRSQSFDHAYNIFSKYLIENYRQIVDQRFFNLSDVYGTEVTHYKMNLSRYYAKHIGCRVAERAGRVPVDLVSFLNGETENAPCVYSEFGINAELLTLNEYQILSLRNSVADYSTDTQHAGLKSFKSGVGIGAVEFIYDINLDSERFNSGNGIIASSYQDLWIHDKGLYEYQIHAIPPRAARPFRERLLALVSKAGLSSRPRGTLR